MIARGGPWRTPWPEPSPDSLTETPRHRALDGPVTIIFGNVDGGDQDFTIVLVNTPTIHTTDFQF
jgi:hypothetical protein